MFPSAPTRGCYPVAVPERTCLREGVFWCSGGTAPEPLASCCSNGANLWTPHRSPLPCRARRRRSQGLGLSQQRYLDSKCLDMTISNDLSWDNHIHNSWQGNNALSFLRRNFRDCTIPVKKVTYTATVRPRTECFFTVWDPVSPKHNQMPEQVQRRAARYVFNNYTDQSQDYAAKKSRKSNRLCACCTESITTL